MGHPPAVPRSHQLPPKRALESRSPCPRDGPWWREDAHLDPFGASSNPEKYPRRLICSVLRTTARTVGPPGAPFKKKSSQNSARCWIVNIKMWKYVIYGGLSPWENKNILKTVTLKPKKTQNGLHKKNICTLVHIQGWKKKRYLWRTITFGNK